MTRPLAVIGVGNPMRSDDGVGPRAIAELRRVEQRPMADLFQLDGEPTRLLEAWRARRSAIVIDAATSAAAPPGTIHRLELGIDDAALLADTGVYDSHRAGLATAIALGTVFDVLPDRLVVFCVEVADVSFGEGLSEFVEAAVPALVDQVCREIGQR